MLRIEREREREIEKETERQKEIISCMVKNRTTMNVYEPLSKFENKNPKNRLGVTLLT